MLKPLKSSIRNTSPFLVLHSRAHAAPIPTKKRTRSTQKCELGPRKQIAWEGDNRQHTTHGRTSRLLDQIGPVGQFSEKRKKRNLITGVNKQETKVLPNMTKDDNYDYFTATSAIQF